MQKTCILCNDTVLYFPSFFFMSFKCYLINVCAISVIDILNFNVKHEILFSIKLNFTECNGGFFVDCRPTLYEVEFVVIVYDVLCVLVFLFSDNCILDLHCFPSMLPP